MPNSLTSKRSLFFPLISKTFFVSTFGRLIPPTEVRKSKTLVCKWLISRFDVCNCCVTWFLLWFELLFIWTGSNRGAVLYFRQIGMLGGGLVLAPPAVVCFRYYVFDQCSRSVAVATFSLVSPSAISHTLSLPLRFYHVKEESVSTGRHSDIARDTCCTFFSPTHFGNGHSPFDTSGCLCCYQLFYPLGYAVLQYVRPGVA